MQTNTRDYWTQMNNAYLRAVEQVADRMHNGNQNQQQYHSKDKPGRSPKEDMGYRSLENKPSENAV